MSILPTEGTARPHWQLQDYLDLNLIGATHGLSDGFAKLLVPVLALIVADLQLSVFEAGLLLSSFTAAEFLFLYPLSTLADHSGHKKWILIGGLGLATGAFLAMYWTTSFWLLVALAFLAGAGNAVYHPCGTALTALRFAGRRAFAISYHGMWGNIGVSVVPVVQAAVAAMAGWRTAVAVCALPALLLLPLIGIRFPSGKRDQESAPTGSLQNSVKALTGQVLRNRSVILLAFTYALNGLSTKGMTGFLPLLAVTKFGMETATVGVILACYFGAGVVAKPLMGLLYDRWGARSALFTPLVLTGFLTLALGFTPWSATLLVLAIITGIFTPISPIILTAAADVADEEVLASATGEIYTCYGLGFLSPLIGGWLADHFQLESSYLFFALMAWIGATVSTMLPPRTE
ncbi:MAG: MFS transporter [Caldilineaceae bacterium]|nr:MFS transporter [Caldilineaceae bacterium]